MWRILTSNNNKGRLFQQKYFNKGVGAANYIT